MNNREISEVWMADILSRLYDTWPQQVTMDIAATVDATKVAPEGQREILKVWSDLWRWLNAEGIVRMRPERGDTPQIHYAVLTAKGFEALKKSVPGTGESVGQKLGDLAKTAGKDVVMEGSKTAVAEVIGTFLASMLKSGLSL